MWEVGHELPADVTLRQSVLLSLWYAVLAVDAPINGNAGPACSIFVFIRSAIFTIGEDMRGHDPLKQLHMVRHKQRMRIRMPRRDNYERREFPTSAERNEFYAAMKAIKSGTVKYSTVAGNRSVFVCAWPLRLAS